VTRLEAAACCSGARWPCWRRRWPALRGRLHAPTLEFHRPPSDAYACENGVRDLQASCRAPPQRPRRLAGGPGRPPASRSPRRTGTRWSRPARGAPRRRADSRRIVGPRAGRGDGGHLTGPGTRWLMTGWPIHSQGAKWSRSTDIRRGGPIARPLPVSRRHTSTDVIPRRPTPSPARQEEGEGEPVGPSASASSGVASPGAKASPRPREAVTGAPGPARRG